MIVPYMGTPASGMSPFVKGFEESWSRPARWAARQALRGSRRQPAANLEEVTLEPQGPLPDCADGPGTRGQLACNLTEYPDGWRVVAFRRSAPASSSKGRSPTTGPEGIADPEPSASVPVRCDASIQRTKRLVVHRVRSLSPTALWTFTKRGKFASQDELWSAWRLFGQSMRRRFGSKFRYVAVPELHSDGVTWHMHVAVDRFYMVETLRSWWYRSLGGTGRETGAATPGSVNVKPMRARYTAGRRVAGYVASYIGKGLGQGNSARRLFGASLGLAPRRVVRWHCPFDHGLVEFFDSVGRRGGLDFGIPRLFPRIHISRSYVAAIADTD